MNILKTKLSLSIKIPTLKDSNSIKTSNESISNHAQQKSECNLIFENIYLSGHKNASDLEFLSNNNFTHIINCAKDSKNFSPKNFQNFNYLNLSIEDDPGFAITDAIKTFIDFIENANKASPSRKILVHCFEGISRAPSLLAAYLIWKLQISKESALKFIKEKRPCIEINLGFLYQLERWSKLCEDKKKLLNKKVKFSIKKSNLLKIDDINYSINAINSNGDENYLNFDIEQNGLFLHSKIRVVEQASDINDNCIGVIRILSCNKENEEFSCNNKLQEIKINEQKTFNFE